MTKMEPQDYPYDLKMLHSERLYESYDVVYRFYPPVDEPKQYQPFASLLVIIEDI